MTQDSWSETALIAITAQGGSDVQFACSTETVDVDIGDKDFDSINTLCGGRLPKFNPQGPTTITFEAYPVEAGTATGTTGTGFFDLMNTTDAAQPLQISVDKARDKYRVAILWTNAISPTSATQVLTSAVLAEEGLRIVAADGYFTSVKPSFTDGILKFTVMFKVEAFDKANSANVKIESTDGTADLPALTAYTSTVKW